MITVGFADDFSIHPENFTIHSDTTRVAFECRINTFIATQNDSSRLLIVWEGSSANDTFTMFSGDDIFNPVPGYSILVMDYDDTLPVMFRCQAVFTPLMGDDMVIATSEVAYIINITDILGECYCCNVYLYVTYNAFRVGVYQWSSRQQDFSDNAIT